MKKILIIGGSGFIGSRLIKTLLNKDIIIINFDLINSNIESKKIINIIGDIREKSDFNKLPIDVDAIYILAAIHTDKIKDHGAYYSTNHIGVKNIINHSIEFSIENIIFFSSAAVYGESFTNVNEYTKLNPENDYGKSKYLAELELYKWEKENNNRQLVVIRPSVVYGKGAKNNLSRMIDFISRGKFIMVGYGNNVKSICHVDNLVHFTNYVTNNLDEKCSVFNYADFPNCTVRELTKKISTIAGSKIISIPYVIAYSIGIIFDFLSIITKKELNFTSSRVRRFCDNTSYDDKKIKNFNFKHTINFINSIEETIS